MNLNRENNMINEETNCDHNFSVVASKRIYPGNVVSEGVSKEVVTALACEKCGEVKDLEYG